MRRQEQYAQDEDFGRVHDKPMGERGIITTPLRMDFVVA